MKSRLVASILAVSVSACSAVDEDVVAREVLAHKMNERALIVDVRQPEEFREGHVPGAVNIPYKEVRERIERYEPDRTRPIAVYCGRGGRAAKAEETLQGMGYSNVANLGSYNYLK